MPLITSPLLRHRTPALSAGVVAALLAGCGAVRPQRGGLSTTTLGGATAPTVVTSAAPENPATPSTTTVEKTTVRDYRPGPPAAPTPSHPTPVVAPVPSLPVSSVPALIRETVSERATTITGVAQKDTARELGTRLANLRGVLWVGVLLLVGGPLVGWKLGWFANGCIAGAVGLLLIILSTVLPGHEAWFGLLGLGIIPVVAFAYYRAHHDATAPQRPTPPAP
ncbi:MAG: hypothetical protein NTV51_03155 [Verrucomicrobia bacterium]|nr:hypothetical protein [Verrucomicrobiota bacterium]